MTKNWMKGAAAAAMIVATAVAAQAADLPTRKEAPAPVYVPPPFSWTGFYIGVNAGGLWSTGNTKVNAFFPTTSIFYSNYYGNSLGTGASGFIGGGQAGYNFQSGAAVFGIETDFDGTSASKSKSTIGSPFTVPFATSATGTDYFTTNASSRLNWLGTTRARVGFVATPDNRLMIYGTGGVAYGGGNAHANGASSLEHEEELAEGETRQLGPGGFVELRAVETQQVFEDESQARLARADQHEAAHEVAADHHLHVGAAQQLHQVFVVQVLHLCWQEAQGSAILLRSRTA